MTPESFSAETAMKSASQLISALSLQPHPEGGWFRETYRSGEVIPAQGLPDRYAGPRAFSTAIYFLLTSESFSAFHRLRSDELWHFYRGSALIVHVITPQGEYAPLRLGPEAGQGDRCQVVVPHGCWFAATVAAAEAYSLVGCTVAPGFDFADFEIARREELLARFPQHWELIRHLTRG
jgi:uncharacterized protein